MSDAYLLVDTYFIETGKPLAVFTNPDTLRAWLLKHRPEDVRGTLDGDPDTWSAIGLLDILDIELDHE